MSDFEEIHDFEKFQAGFGGKEGIEERLKGGKGQKGGRCVF